MTLATGSFWAAPAARSQGIAQFPGVGWIHPKRGSFYIILGVENDLAGKYVAEGDQTGETINQLGRFHISRTLHQHLSVQGRAGQTKRLQDGNFAAVQFNLALHRSPFVKKPANVECEVVGEKPRRSSLRSQTVRDVSTALDMTDSWIPREDSNIGSSSLPSQAVRDVSFFDSATLRSE
jgi:hypothetical protein